DVAGLRAPDAFERCRFIFAERRRERSDSIRCHRAHLHFGHWYDAGGEREVGSGFGGKREAGSGKRDRLLLIVP
ncbi:MAG: hypothetical protein ACJ785_01130, partial [Gemmatimonadaceae bacterium]